MSGKKGKSGGYREGAKRPFKYGEPTRVMRIPISLIPKVQKLLDKAKVVTLFVTFSCNLLIYSI